MTTACIDWQDRIINRRSLIVAPPLYPDEAAEALEMFKSLRVVDAPGQPTFGETAGQWVLDLVASIFGAYNKDTGVREIGEFFLLVSKKNGKAIDVHTPIPTPIGWKTMGELQVGDLVYGINGQPCNVIATSEVFTDHKCYKMTFSNGESVIADAGHLWVTNGVVRTTEEIAGTDHVVHTLQTPARITNAQALANLGGQPEYPDDPVSITRCRPTTTVPVKCIAVDSPDRQFLFGRTMLPTHNSLLSAGIMLTALLRNWRQSNELIIVAPSIKAANNSFKPAADMVRADPRLDSAKGGSLHVIDHERKIKHLTTGATLQVLSADAGIVVGVKAGFVLIDEMWQFGESHKANAMLREATGGLVTRPEGFIMTITTQSDKPPAGEFKDKLNYARDVRDGKIIDPRFLPVLYEFPPHMIKSKAYLDLNNAYITNPYLAYEPVAFDWLKQEMKKELAKDISSQNIFLSKHLNVEIGQGDRSDRWAGAEFWPKAARKGLTYESILDTSELVCVGIDGGGLDDLFGFSVIGRHRETKQWQCWSHAWAHVGVKERRKSIATRLDDFDKAGELTFVDDELKDLTSIIDLIADIKSRGILAMVSVDPAGLGEMIEALAEIGVTQDAKNLYASPQGGYMMNAIKTAERMLVSERMVHDGSDLMSWCVSNLKIEPTATTIRATKQTAGDAKIDPVMAMFNAVAAMVLLPAVPREKEYQILVVG